MQRHSIILRPCPREAGSETAFITLFFYLLPSGMCMSDASFDDGNSLPTIANFKASGRGNFCVTYWLSYDTYMPFEFSLLHIRRGGSYLSSVVTLSQFSAIETLEMDLIKFKIQDLLWVPTSLISSGYWFLFLQGLKRLGHETGDSHQSVT